MKTFFMLCAISLCITVSAQKCYKPEPMTTEQITTVKGTWTGSYQYEGKTYSMTVNLYTNNNITCNVEGGPVTGEETGEEIRFCDGGESHFKKMVGELSYEFQGTPKENHIEGMLTVRKDDVKIGKNGRFQLNRKDG